MALFHFVNHCSSAQHYVPVNCWHLRASEKNMHVNREISSLHKHFHTLYSYIADVGWRFLIELLTWNLFFPAFLPKVWVYGHYVTFRRENVFGPRLVQRVVFVKELQRVNTNQ